MWKEKLDFFKCYGCVERYLMIAYDGGCLYKFNKSIFLDFFFLSSAERYIFFVLYIKLKCQAQLSEGTLNLLFWSVFHFTTILLADV
jgi:hypothetical protein